MTRRWMHLLTLLGLALCVACKTHSHDGDDHPHGHDDHSHDDHGHAHGHEDDERPALSFTDWTAESELFIELPALVRGQESACAAHVTKLDGFVALAEGSVTVVLRGGSTDERFEAKAPTVPGIFRPVAKPAAVGKRQLVVEIRAPGFSADHDLGEVTVFENVAAASAAIPDEPEAAGRITFLKEQQWPIEFATAMVSERPMRPTLRATGTVRARSDGDVLVTAPVAGRVASGGRAFPKTGDRVAVQDLLFVVAPRLEAADLASLELAVTSANLELRFAERERQRLEGLRVEGAVPERRVQDAVHAVDENQASLATAQRRLDQFRHVERPSGRGEGTVQLRAPLSGTITEVHIAPGSFVEAGTPLFRVTDLTQLWLEAHVAEADVGRVGSAAAATFVIEGVEEAIEVSADALVTRGHVIDPRTRTLPLVFAVDNASGRLSLGGAARAYVATADAHDAVAVPDAALIDDGGMFVVFVQVEGEAFERRVVRLGVHDRGYVEVLSGVVAGEHVATRGAWSVKLAASGGSIPAHGHAH